MLIVRFIVPFLVYENRLKLIDCLIRCVVAVWALIVLFLGFVAVDLSGASYAGQATTFA